jgi:hypothetical protein
VPYKTWRGLRNLGYDFGVESPHNGAGVGVTSRETNGTVSEGDLS